MKKKEKRKPKQTTGTSHTAAWSKHRGGMVKPHVIPAMKARTTRHKYSLGMSFSVIFENNISAAAWSI